MLKVDFNTVVGNIKPMHAVGQPPFHYMDFSCCAYLQQAGIPYSRLHDVGGKYGRNEFVDIPNIFRDFSADENDPASYDFEHTDYLIAQLYKYNCAPIFRLGVTIENDHLAGFKAQRIHPPADFGKWARICEHIVRHYNEGWANGFHYGIVYWEIWNEPENRHDPAINQMWTGTKEQYYELYDVTAKHLKACFGDTVKVGGYAATGFYHIFVDPAKYGADTEGLSGETYTADKYVYRMEFLYGFLEYIRAHKTPLDFFSWHSYVSAKETAIMARFVDKVLKEYGYGDAETQLNEWNNAARIPDTKGTAAAAAAAAEMLLRMQNTPTSMLCYYDAAIGLNAYAGMFHPMKREPYCLFYAFSAFNCLYTLKNQVLCECSEEIQAVAAANGDKKAVMLVNTADKDVCVTTNLDDGFEMFAVNEQYALQKVAMQPTEFVIPKHTVILIKN